MSICKIVKFYQFKPQPSLINNGIEPMSTFEVLKKIFSKCSNYNINYNQEKYIIDIIELEDNYLFGKCAKENELLYTSFYQTRDKLTMETSPYTSLSPDTQLEVYTYFYIDCLQNRMAAIKHKSITKIQDILAKGVWDLSGNTLNVFIAPERITDIKGTARKIKQNKKLSLSFAPNAISKYNIDNLAKCLGSINYDSFSIEIKLSQNSDNSAIDRIYDIFTKDRDSFKGLKLSGKNDLGIEETIDFVETIYSQNTTFDITQDIANNSKIIRTKLAESLINNMDRS